MCDMISVKRSPPGVTWGAAGTDSVCASFPAGLLWLLSGPCDSPPPGLLGSPLGLGFSIYVLMSITIGLSVVTITSGGGRLESGVLRGAPSVSHPDSVLSIPTLIDWVVFFSKPVSVDSSCATRGPDREKVEEGLVSLMVVCVMVLFALVNLSADRKWKVETL